MFSKMLNNIFRSLHCFYNILVKSYPNFKNKDSFVLCVNWAIDYHIKL